MDKLDKIRLTVAIVCTISFIASEIYGIFLLSIKETELGIVICFLSIFWLFPLGLDAGGEWYIVEGGDVT